MPQRRQNGVFMEHTENNALDAAPVRSVLEIITQASEKYGDKPLFAFEREHVDYEMSYPEYAEYARAMTRGFIHLGLAGKRVAVIGETSPEWLTTYIATVTSGGVIVPIDVALSQDQFVEFIKRVDAQAIAYSNTWAQFIEENEDKFEGVENFIRLTDDEFDFSSAKEYKLERYMRASQIAHTGNAVTDIEIPEQNTEKMSVMLFTSGTTGTSKIVMLSQKNICAVINGARKPLEKVTVEDTILSVLPIHHTYELTCGVLGGIDHGVKICINDSIKHVTKNIKKYKPTLMVVVPLYVEVFYNTIIRTVKKQGIEKKFNMALKLSRMAGKVNIDLRKQLFATVIESFGGRLGKIICGGAPLRPELVETFDAIGIRITQGYGITECSPLVAAVPFDVLNPKSCGVLIGGVQVFIDKEKPDDEFGEIVVKGDNVMLGYYDNESATREVLSPKGWFYTGDYGYLDENNYLYITGRKKNMIVLQDGKNVFPEEIEEYISAIPLIKESVVVGRARDNDLAITALIYPDKEYAAGEGLTKREDIYNAIRLKINEMNRGLVGYKRVASIEFRDEPFEKTPSQKIKRFLYK